MLSVKSMSDAIQARDEGMASSANHAETDTPGWGELAYQIIQQISYLRVMPGWTMEQASQVAYARGLEVPAERRAWGSVTQRLIRDGIIEPVGYARAASSNSSWKRTYRLVRS